MNIGNVRVEYRDFAVRPEDYAISDAPSSDVFTEQGAFRISDKDNVQTYIPYDLVRKITIDWAEVDV